MNTSTSSAPGERNSLIDRFYLAFQAKDYRAMQSLYHDEAKFSDPVFVSLNAREVRAMWQMLVTSGKDLRIIHREVTEGLHGGSCTWEAWYRFGPTGRPVHNIINASFAFRDGRILRHHDQFSFRRWSRQALGLPGWIFGGTAFMQRKVQKTAQQRLAKFMQEPGTE